MDNILRTDGDGMEKMTHDVSEISKKGGTIQNLLLRDKFIYNHDNFRTTALKPPNISGELVQIRPVPFIEKGSKHDVPLQSSQGKEPKFVPYEPYKGAVKPMVPFDNIPKQKTKLTFISTLPKPKSEVKTSDQDGFLDNIAVQPQQQHTHLSDSTLKELERLQKENQQLENQLKFQIQVKKLN